MCPEMSLGSPELPRIPLPRDKSRGTSVLAKPALSGGLIALTGDWFPRTRARAVMRSLSLDVSDERLEGDGSDGLGPVADLRDEWRERMKTEDAKRAYRSRAGLCELVNAHLKSHHGTAHVLVRGLEKVTCVALLGALANNLLAHATALLG